MAQRQDVVSDQFKNLCLSSFDLYRLDLDPEFFWTANSNRQRELSVNDLGMLKQLRFLRLEGFREIP